jgi:hypothetical protein
LGEAEGESRWRDVAWEDMIARQLGEVEGVEIVLNVFPESLPPRMACDRVWENTMVTVGMGGEESGVVEVAAGNGNRQALTRFQDAKRAWTRCGRPLLAETTYTLGQPLNAV